MAECINCNNEAFESIGDDAVVINGIVSDDLGITQGMTLRQVIFILAEEIEKLKEPSMETSVEQEIGNITTSEPRVSKSQNTFSLSVTPSQTNTKIDYDINDAIGGKGVTAFTRVTAFGTSSGRATKVHESSGRAGSFNVAPESFPLNLSIESTVIEGKGQKVYKFSKTVANESQLTDEFMDVTDLAQREVKKQSDVNELLDRKIGNALSRINALEQK